MRGELKVELVAPGLGIAGVNGVLLPRELLGGEGRLGREKLKWNVLF